MKPQEQPRVNAREIRWLLFQREMRQADLARALGVERATISKLLLGRRPKSHLPVKIAKFFRVPLQQIMLFNGQNEMSDKPHRARGRRAS